MKLLHIMVHFEFADAITQILDQHDVTTYARYTMIEGKDSEGKHYGTQVFPGNVSVIQAQVSESSVDELLDRFQSFRQQKRSHQHLEVVVLPIERRLGDEDA
ncbi:MAG: PG0541 family transporter-associated protein [Planctomycetota bacterium]